MKYLNILLLCLTLSTTALADEGMEIHGILGGGLTAGGDTLGTLYFTNGESSNLKAGALIHIYGGILLANPQSPFQMKLAMGWHFDDVNSANGSASFARYPLDIMPYFKSDKIRVGLGLSYHLNPELDASDFNSSVDKFKNAAGVAFEIGYNARGDNRLWFELRHVSIDYELDSQFATGTIDGSHTGIYSTLVF